ALSNHPMRSLGLSYLIEELRSPRWVCSPPDNACARKRPSPCWEEDGGEGHMGGIARVVGVCGALLACTSVKMVQREGCWVKQTERTFGGSTEELGFCAKARPQWAEDRLARLVQECMAQADYRWENRALAAWTRGDPIPPQDSDDQVARTCMGQ